MYSFSREKSWSVRLTNGYVLDGQVKSARCRGCERKPKLLIGNDNNPDLVLFGCEGSRCRHTLIRMNLRQASEQKMLMIKLAEAKLMQAQIRKKSEGITILQSLAT